jgi:release factor glutamine methyltransferase
LSKCLQSIERRIQGEPVSYITNKKDFLNYTFYVPTGVLIPRPETELLVEYVLHWVEEKALSDIWTLDLGCGTGCIGLSLAKEVFKMNVVEVDISSVAIEATNKNTSDLQVTDKVSILQKDADTLSYKDFEFLKPKGFSGQFDVVISNPPYIAKDDPQVQDSVKKHEPREALYCENEGFEKIEKWTNLAGSVLKDGGLWIFEIGSSQGRKALQIVQQSGFFKEIQLAQDYAGHDRFIIATKQKIKTNN